MADETLTDFVRAAFNLRDAARFVIEPEAFPGSETFGHAELIAALREFAVVNRAIDDASGDIVLSFKRL